MLNIDTESEFIFTEGCYGIVEKKFLHWLDTLIVVQSFLAVFTAIALIGSSCWIRSIRRSAIRELNYKSQIKNSKLNYAPHFHPVKI